MAAEREYDGRMSSRRNVAVLFLALAGCSKDCTAVEGKTSGRIESSGTTGKWVLAQGKCYSGEREGFFGVTAEAQDGTDASVMFVKDPTGGWVVKARIAGTCDAGTCTYKVFTKHECKTLDVNLKLDPTRDRLFNGTATVDCSVEGAHVSGTLTMEACRAPFGR
jgi:hypothetical protein